MDFLESRFYMNCLLVDLPDGTPKGTLFDISSLMRSSVMDVARTLA
jgi:hypothetical protein